MSDGACGGPVDEQNVCFSGTFWIHVRSAGHWTRSLYKYFEDYKSSVVDAEEGMADNKGQF